MAVKPSVSVSNAVFQLPFLHFLSRGGGFMQHADDDVSSWLSLKTILWIILSLYRTDWMAHTHLNHCTISRFRGWETVFIQLLHTHAHSLLWPRYCSFQGPFPSLGNSCGPKRRGTLGEGSRMRSGPIVWQHWKALCCLHLFLIISLCVYACAF